MESFKAIQFDIALGENFDLCFFGVLKLIGVNNYISISSGGVWEQTAMSFGVHPTPSFIPSMILKIKKIFNWLPTGFRPKSIELKHFLWAGTIHGQAGGGTGPQNTN